MAPFKSLYDSLLEQGLIEPEVPATQIEPLITATSLTGKAFSEAVLNSEEFRLYIVEGITDRNLPPAILLRLMDHGWGKPADHVEHSGRIDSVTEVRRVVIHQNVAAAEEDEDTPTVSRLTH